ncbi:MAG: peptidylprolyl isomerase [Planctomycetota bacterium]|jgi:parvulin-like peptidyl-prolyl isomerase
MEEKLDFSLPEKKQRNTIANKISVVLLLILVILTIANLLTGPSEKPYLTKGTATSSLSAQQTKQLAAKLAQRNLYARAVKVWQDYLNVAELTDTERAKVLFQIGTSLEKAGSYAEAIEYYYRSEIAAKIDELTPQINTHIKDCFEKLGKFSAMRYELIDRTSFKKSSEAGGKIVAEIGAEKITEADLDATIENSIDNQLTPMSAFMTTEQLNEQKKKMLEQYRNPEAREQYLQGWLAQEVLYRQALQEQMTEKAEVKKLLDDLSRGVLSQQLMNQQLADKIHITETDIQTYYTANKDKFVEPAKARISHILAEDQQLANELLGRIKDGEDFGKLAREFSKDEGTKETGGKIDIDVNRGSYVPVIGESKELNDKIFTANAPTVLDEPVKTEKGWEVVKVEEITVERQKSFDEVGQEVMSTLLNQKRQDVQQDYIKEMMDKYNVIIHRSVLTGTNQSESDEKPVETAK